MSVGLTYQKVQESSSYHAVYYDSKACKTYTFSVSDQGQGITTVYQEYMKYYINHFLNH